MIRSVGRAERCPDQERSGSRECDAFETIIFDKTGTLTLGKPEVVEIVAASGRTEGEVLALAAGWRRTRSTHSRTRFSTERRGRSVFRQKDSRTSTAWGRTRFPVGSRGLVGNRRLMDSENVDLAGRKGEEERLAGGGRTVVLSKRPDSAFGAHGRRAR